MSSEPFPGIDGLRAIERAVLAETKRILGRRFDKRRTDVYTSNMSAETFGKAIAETLFNLPCACQNLRRLTRIVTRIYDQELTKAGIEIAQFGVLTALGETGETNQK